MLTPKQFHRLTQHLVSVQSPFHFWKVRLVLYIVISDVVLPRCPEGIVQKCLKVWCKCLERWLLLPEVFVSGRVFHSHRAC